MTEILWITGEKRMEIHSRRKDRRASAMNSFARERKDDEVLYIYGFRVRGVMFEGFVQTTMGGGGTHGFPMSASSYKISRSCTIAIRRPCFPSPL